MAFAVPVVSSADEFTSIGWRDLTYPIEPQDDPFFGLNYEQRRHLETILAVSRKREKGAEVPERDESLAVTSSEWLRSHGLDPEQLVMEDRTLLEKIARQRSSSRAELAGKDVRILGYVIPLAFEKEKVTEFLLVPYYGACVHTPPPPANQIVFVRSELGTEIDGLFTAVWVEGRLGVERNNRVAILSDGTAGFEVGYSLDAVSVRRSPLGRRAPYLHQESGRPESASGDRQ